MVWKTVKGVEEQREATEELKRHTGLSIRP